MKLRMMITVLLLLLIAPATEILALQAVGRVTAVSGDAKATGEDGKRRTLAMRSNIYLNDVVVTKDDSRVQICFRDNTTISQGENGQIKIDKYVYDPTDKKKNSFFGTVIKGAFRIVTGKITELNPDKFKVRTRMATVGIRGCGVGIFATSGSVQVFSLELSDGSVITIDFVAGGSDTLGQPGYVLTIKSNGKTTKRRISGRDAHFLMSQTMPGSAFLGDTASRLQGIWPIQDPTNGGKSGDGSGDGSGLDDVPWWAQDLGLPVGGGGGSDYPRYGPRTYVQMWGGGVDNDWTGYDWSRVVEEMVNGTVQARTEHGVVFNANPGMVWTGPLVSTPTFYWNGDAAAYITQNGVQLPRLEGGCWLDVTLGDGVGTWDGGFNMDNAWAGGDDSLDFDETGGVIDGSGRLSFNGGPDTYTLTIGGVNQGVPSGWGFTGQLVGDPALAQPSGATTRFNFQQPDGTTVSGGAAADAFGGC